MCLDHHRSHRNPIVPSLRLKPILYILRRQQITHTHLPNCCCFCSCPCSCCCLFLCLSSHRDLLFHLPLHLPCTCLALVFALDVALASRYPKALALGLSDLKRKGALALGYSVLSQSQKPQSSMTSDPPAPDSAHSSRPSPQARQISPPHTAKPANPERPVGRSSDSDRSASDTQSGLR